MSKQATTAALLVFSFIIKKLFPTAHAQWDVPFDDHVLATELFRIEERDRATGRGSSQGLPKPAAAERDNGKT